MTLTERLDVYERLMRLDKPIGILLLLWPTLWGLWLSSYGSPNPWITAVFVLGVVLMRSAGCIVNDIADRTFDLHVQRTRDRPLAAGRIGTTEALMLAGLLMALALSLVLQLNALTVKLSVIAALLAVSYPYLKRFFWFPQAYLGVAFGFGIPMAFAAHGDQVVPIAWTLVVANIFWAMAYDTEYAMVDRDDDVRLRLKSTAILFGRFDVLGVMVCHGLFLLTMLYVGYRARLGAGYICGLALAAAFAAYQYQLISGRGREGCFKAFLNNNLTGAAIFGGIVVDFVLRIPVFPGPYLGLPR
jgi:4-hydroxybenzoate polyprenyltransferase